MDGSRNLREREARFKSEEPLAGAGMLGRRVLKCPDFAGEGVRVIDGGADLDEVLRSIDVAGEEIHFEAVWRLDVGDLGPAALEFDENGGFESVAGVGFAATVKDGNEGGIGRIGFAGIDLAAFLRVGGDRNGLQEERVLQMGKELVKVFAAYGDGLGLEIGGELCHRKKTGG